MTPKELLAIAIIPALTELDLDSLPARHMLLAIALQETGVMHRRQVTADGREAGPAVSFWQFEKGGACTGVLTHPKCATRMKVFCAGHGITTAPAALWEAMKTNDVLGAAAARLLLYTLPNKLPLASVDGWNQYVAAWRPGKPHKATWDAHWYEAGRLTRGFV
jgi:hypothetical protein